MKTILSAALIALAAPILAQTPPTPTQAATAAGAAVDPARLVAATRVVARIWPLGTYRRMMNGMMDKVMESTMASMADMRVSDAAGMSGASADVQTKMGNQTIGQTMAKVDPAYRERMRITTKVMTEEMIGMMSDIEPDIQTALARAYAKRFTQDQLDDLNRFFTTPTGALYARDAMLITTDPEMMKAMQSFMPVVMRRMPAIVQKAKAATAHLPPVTTRPGVKAE